MSNKKGIIHALKWFPNKLLKDYGLLNAKNDQPSFYLSFENHFVRQ